MDTQQIEKFLSDNEITVSAEFVPFSKSRNAGEKSPSLNWIVTLKKGNRAILSTDYSAGCGHTPAYKSKEKDQYIKNKMIRYECETGKQIRFWMEAMDAPMGYSPSRPILPDSKDVIYSLLLDSEVLDFDGFESWAHEFGYDTDSRAAEKTYNECMKFALKFNTLGYDTIQTLRELFQDY